MKSARAVRMLALGLFLGSWGDSLARAEDAAQPKFRWGADERIREEGFDHLPLRADPPGVARGGENNYLRFRTRLWAEFDPLNDITLRARAVNEYRIWITPNMASKPQRSNWDFPDEIVFDNLYLDLRDLVGDHVDLRVGRQDLIYGTGKVLLEGTPKDGSRTIYFNAIKATLKGVPDANTTVDFLGILNPSIDDLALHSADRDLTGQTSATDDITESGAGLYLKNKSCAALPFEAYYLFKDKSPWQQTVSSNVVQRDELQLNTLGGRLMPVFSDRLRGNLELAYQFGDRGGPEVRGFMADLFLVWTAPCLTEMKPAVEYGVYYLSGDNPATPGKDEGWNPPWARYPQFSELYVYAWDADAAGRWSNIAVPRVQATLSPLKGFTATAMLGWLYAPEADGPGGGHARGWLEVLKGEFTLREKLLTKTDKLTGHLWLELFEPGDYYKVDDLAYFFRWELAYAF